MEKVLKFFKGLFLCGGLFTLYFAIFPLFFAYLFNPLLFSENYWISNFAYLLIYLLTFILILLIVRKDIWKQFKEFYKSPKNILNVGWTYWAYGIIVMIVSNLIISSFVQSIAVNEQMTRETLISNPIYSIPTIIFIGPFLEEVIFRYALRKGFDKKMPYAICSALIFGMLHVISAFDSFTISNILEHASEFLFLIPYGSLGFFFAKAYYETDNIFSSIIPHMLHNTLSVILIYIMHFFM